MTSSATEPPRSAFGPFGFVLRVFFRGLAAILPLALTGYLIYLAVTASEALLRSIVLLVIDEDQYWDGMGLMLSVGIVLTIGLLMYSFLVRRIYRLFTAVLERIPGVKTLYGMIADVMRILATDEERPFQHVVLVKLPEGMEQIGFLTRDGFDDQPEIGADKVAVYLPMSYQLGGFTVILPRDAVRRLSMPFEDAMRFCVTAGVSRPDEDA